VKSLPDRHSPHPVGAKVVRVPGAAQHHSARRRACTRLWRCAADPGPLRTPPLERSRISGAPFATLTLHRVRDTTGLAPRCMRSTAPCASTDPKSSAGRKPSCRLLIVDRWGCRTCCRGANAAPARAGRTGAVAHANPARSPRHRSRKRPEFSIHAVPVAVHALAKNFPANATRPGALNSGARAGPPFPFFRFPKRGMERRSTTSTSQTLPAPPTTS